MKLSVCMIVKNEESCIVKCLESVKEADEIIIVDTGSTDKTISIAKEFTDKVYTDYKWNDDFSQARNHSLAKCTGDWILAIDADEWLGNTIQEIKDSIESTKEEGIYVTIAGDTMKHQFMKLFKRAPHIKWKGAIHNYMSITKGANSKIILHTGYSAAHKQDPTRALRILTKVVKEQPDCVREKYYLAREHYYRHDWRLAIYYYDEYLEVAHWSPEIADAHLMKARCLFNINQGEQARDECLQAIKYNANFKEALLFMARITGPKNSVRWTDIAMSATNEDVLFIREPEEKGSEYYDNLFKHNHDFSRYKAIHQKIGQMVGDKSVLDVGCGPATLAEYIPNYKGFDFSKEAVKQANNKNVWLGDAYDKDNYVGADYYILTEVLEHLDDLRVLENVPEGKVIFSVPSFTDPSHIRVFTEKIVRERYPFLDIKTITRYNWHGKWVEEAADTNSYILLIEAEKRNPQ